MERIAALVEGQTEHHFIRKTYANSVIQRPFPNGKDVSLALIAECLIGAIDTLGGEITKIIVLLDREGRPETAAEIQVWILGALVAACPTRSFYVGITDRHIENWILSDQVYIRQMFGDMSYQYAGDGTKGKSILDEVSGKTLRGPADKAEMLKATSPSAGKLLSPSLAVLCDAINFDWYWVAK